MDRKSQGEPPSSVQPGGTRQAVSDPAIFQTWSSQARVIVRAIMTFDHFYFRYLFWKIGHGLDLVAVPADRLGLHASLRGNSDTGGPRLAAVLRRLSLPRDWSALDIGSGKGGACFTLARFFDRVTGIELSPELVEIARSNQRKLGNVRLAVMLLNRDARSFDYDRFQVFYMANPFGSEVAQTVLERVEDSLDHHNRPAALLVYHPGQVDQWIHPRRFALKRIERFRNSHPFYVFSVDAL